MTIRKLSRALILDCDGVIVNSEPLSCGAWNVVFEREFGIDVGTDYQAILGGSTRAAVLHYLRKHDIPVTGERVAILSSLKEQVYLELAEGNLDPVEGVDSVIDQARNLGWKVGVASSGIPDKIRFSLEQVNLQDRFDVIVGSRPDLRGKPNPDIFLEAAKQLSVEPEQCVVVEDTPKGIQAASRAKMFVTGITTTFTAEQLIQADLVISSFSELSLQSLKDKK